MEQEEYIVDGHRVTHCVHLGDREIFLAVQQDAPLPFYVGYMEVSYELGLARFSGIEGTTEYTTVTRWDAEAARIFCFTTRTRALCRERCTQRCCMPMCRRWAKWTLQASPKSNF